MNNNEFDCKDKSCSCVTCGWWCSCRCNGPDGFCRISKHEAIPFCDGSGRDACVACSEKADRCIPFPCQQVNDEFVQVGTWLLPEAYGHDYDHFTNTKAPTKEGICIAVYAKKSDIEDTRWAYLIPIDHNQSQKDA